MRTIWMVLSFSALVACGDKDSGDISEEADADTDSDTDTDTDTDTDSDTDADTDADTDSDTDADTCDDGGWEAAQSDGSQGGFMAACVLPDMKAAFQKYDGDRYKDFNCSTCHGENKDGTYAMPAVFPLDFKYVDYESPAYLFMADEVTPMMVDMLDAEPYDPKTYQGFGCYGCHQFPN